MLVCYPLRRVVHICVLFWNILVIVYMIVTYIWIFSLDFLIISRANWSTFIAAKITVKRGCVWLWLLRLLVIVLLILLKIIRSFVSWIQLWHLIVVGVYLVLIYRLLLAKLRNYFTNLGNVHWPLRFLSFFSCKVYHVLSSVNHISWVTKVVRYVWSIIWIKRCWICVR